MYKIRIFETSLDGEFHVIQATIMKVRYAVNLLLTRPYGPVWNHDMNLDIFVQGSTL